MIWIKQFLRVHVYSNPSDKKVFMWTGLKMKILA